MHNITGECTFQMKQIEAKSLSTHDVILQSIENMSCEPGVNISRFSTKDSGRIIILNLNDLTSRQLNINSDGSCWYVATWFSTISPGINFTVSVPHAVNKYEEVSLFRE